MDGNSPEEVFTIENDLLLEKDTGLISKESARELSEADLNPFAHITESSKQNRRVKQIWAIGGGKGGVGKSLVSSSLAISLARAGHKVTAIDLDLGGANLHTTLGVDLPKQTLSDFLSGRVQTLDPCVVETAIPRLSIISGAQDSVAVANSGFTDKVRMMQKIPQLDTDYVILDLGAGTNLHTIDFFLYADISLLTLIPEPTSIENAYRFVKTAYFRKLKLSSGLNDVMHLIDLAMDSKNNAGIKSPSDLFRAVNNVSPEAGMRMKREIERFQPKLVMNQTRTQADVDIGLNVKSVCKRYFGIDLDYVGYLDYDSAVWQAVRRKRPLMLEFPNSKLVTSVDRITQYVLKRYGTTRNTL